MKLIFLLIPLFLMSCSQSDITSSWVPKENTQVMLPSAHSEPHREVDWVVPKNWQEQPPSSMRVGSFLVKAKNNQEVDISVIPLSGGAGGDLANVNRWRGQINLPALDSAQLGQQSEKTKIGPFEMILVDYTSTELLIDGKLKKRLVAAIHKKGEQTWFFKMTGEEKAIDEVKPQFLNFLKTLQFHNHG